MIVVFVVLEWLGTEAYLFNSVRVISACLIWIYTLWRYSHIKYTRLVQFNNKQERVPDVQ